ncbi:MAG: hypothetical protein ACQERD_10715 [Campylobacterota bacterium]
MEEIVQNELESKVEQIVKNYLEKEKLKKCWCESTYVNANPKIYRSY